MPWEDTAWNNKGKVGANDHKFRVSQGRRQESFAILASHRKGREK